MAEESSGTTPCIPSSSGNENSKNDEDGTKDDSTDKTKDVESGAPSRDSGATKDEEEEELLFPGFAATSFFCLKQSNAYRYICLKLVTCPYPFQICS